MRLLHFRVKFQIPIFIVKHRSDLELVEAYKYLEVIVEDKPDSSPQHRCPRQEGAESWTSRFFDLCVDDDHHAFHHTMVASGLFFAAIIHQAIHHVGLDQHTRLEVEWNHMVSVGSVASTFKGIVFSM